MRDVGRWRRRLPPLALRRSRIPILAAAAVVAVASAARANPGGGPTGCVHLCQTVWTNYVMSGTIAPCVVGADTNADIAVVAGSHIKCSPLEVHLTQHSLTVQNGGFLLEASRVLVSGNGHRIAATCTTQNGIEPGVRLVVTGDIDVQSSGEIVADCILGGGLIELRAG